MADPHWPRAHEWLAGSHLETSTRSLAVIGAPLHRASISSSRADLAPDAIRDALQRFSVWDPTEGIDVREVAATDVGNLPIAEFSPEDAYEPLSQRLGELRDRFDVVVALGGDNSITRPALSGIGDLERIGLITLDAHFDLRELEDGLTNGNPIRALLRDGFPGPHISQIGIQSFANSPRHAEVAKEAGIDVVTREEVADRGIENVVAATLHRLSDEVDAIYVDFDIDVLDRAFAPATPGSRPGGITPLELCRAAALCGAHPSVVAADIVEVSPPDDVADVTVMTAARVLLTFASGIATRAAVQR